MDREIGRLRAALRTLGIAENTLVWFNSDNGPSYIHDYNSAGPFRGKKADLLEGGIRVPAIVEWPGGLGGGRNLAAAMSTSDIYPTVLAAAGIDLPPNQPRLDGIDVLPLLKGELSSRSGPIAFRSPLRGQGSDADEAKEAFALSGERFKLLSQDGGRNWALYDLLEDPGETTDIAAREAAIVESMKASFLEWAESLE